MSKKMEVTSVRNEVGLFLVEIIAELYLELNQILI